MQWQTDSPPPPGRRERRPYQAPQLGRVKLEADQVLGIGCKTAGGLQFNLGNLINCGLGNGCALPGS